ncbi:MAG: hypothetical protein QMD03_00390 [Syntrophales bacterium]|nr:hypothetical protein [Syntrophales bacterium]
MASLLLSPFPPVDPQIGIRPINHDQDGPSVLLVICPNTMDRIATEGPTVYQTARIRPVGRIILDDFTVKNREVDFIKRELIGPRLLHQHGR